MMPQSIVSSTTSLPTYQAQQRQGRQRATSQAGNYTGPVPTTSPVATTTTSLSAFIGDGSNNNTYDRRRTTSKGEHQGHEQSRNTAGVVDAASGGDGSQGLRHNNNFHYNSKGRQQSIAEAVLARKGSSPITSSRDDAGNQTYYTGFSTDGEADRANEDDDFDSSFDGDLLDVSTNGYKSRNSERDRIAVEDRRQRQQPMGMISEDYTSAAPGGDGHSSSSFSQRAKKLASSPPTSRSGLGNSQSRQLQSQFQFQFQSQSLGFSPSTNIGSIDNGVAAAKPSRGQANSSDRPHQQRPGHGYNQSVSHSANYSQSRNQQQKAHPRSASSAGFYRAGSGGRPPSRTSPPSAPPRVSSLLPPPRSGGANATTFAIDSAIQSGFIGPPGSSAGTTRAAAGPNTHAHTTPFDLPSTLQSLSRPATTSTPTPIRSAPHHQNHLDHAYAHPLQPTPQQHQHPRSRFAPSNSKPGSNYTAASSSAAQQSQSQSQLASVNAVVKDPPTHDQFATSFLDPLNSPPTPFDAAAASTPATGLDLGPRRPRSRASSIGSASDGFRNLNRWSSSTASSRLSAWDYHHYQQQQAQQQKLDGALAHRRMSVDSIGLLSQHSHPDSIAEPQSAIYSSPRNKLSKRRPSLGTATSSTTLRESSPPPPAPPPNLPPIISLSPLDTNPEALSRRGYGEASVGAMGRGSPSVTTPNSIFANRTPNGEEANSYFWDDLSNPVRTASPAMRTATLLPPAPVTRYGDRDGQSERKGHSRDRSTNKGSGDSTRAKERSNKPSQKAMLSKALSKANTAVQLDNNQNYTAARDSYVEACELLQHVLARTGGDEDRKKLEAIRRTYTSRIEELDGLVPASVGDKALPARPDSLDYHDVQIDLAGGDSQSDAATITKSQRDESPNSQVSSNPPRRPSEGITYSDYSRHSGRERSTSRPSFSKSPMRRNFEGSQLTIPHQKSGDGFMPAPLSPRRPISPAKAHSPESVVRQDFSVSSERLAAPSEFRSHRRNLSHESASWLDPIDESGGSTASSIHSRSSSRIIMRHIRQISGDTEAEFDAALDAAVEAAYDEGYEPMDSDMTYGRVNENDDDRIAHTMRKVELAKERVRETERETAIELARERERQRQLSVGGDSQTYGGDFFDANDSDEEERILEEMTRGYVMEDFALGKQSRYQSSVPRESDSSGLTSRTWHSSGGSNPPTTATTLSMVSEKTSSNSFHRKTSLPSMPPPTDALPQPPTRPPSTSGVRNRRLSGQNAKQLKIETSRLGPPPSMPPPPIMTASAVQTKPTGGYIAQQRQALSATTTRPGPFSMRAPSSPVRGISPADIGGPTSPADSRAADFDPEMLPGSPSSPRGGIRENFSSTSLRSLKHGQLTTPHTDDTDPSPNTPLTQSISNISLSRQPTMPALPTPIDTTFGEKWGGVGGLQLFDDFHSPVAHSPLSSYHQLPQDPDVPLPLEPCPSDAMFRPFWLMRALYQTLAHPRGGYVSNRLFVPRDAWKVKGVKLRNLEDKISQCDLLTAALLKLARVDSNDADAVLIEMQSFENILEVVQGTLVRRLGGEVGTQGITEKAVEPVPSVPRNNSVSGKGGAFSWRRLRSKGSAVNLANTYGVKTNSGGSTTNSFGNIAEKEVTSPGGSMPSLPMVAHPSSKPAKRDVASVKFDGPYANYMGSLARLFDAAQTVDQIARQVDDPGLRHADKTQVGLELCTRHAAEFFGFYVCRFVLTDLGMLLDKFVKRGSEWVLT
ncbi:hypothetical protein GGR57DRAFT_230298 [Xylariaceae sp. FL1272]|nr:hypothetical protein GGR57DRAFT_230298 [Xylariaceae sp. FL1272]